MADGFNECGISVPFMRVLYAGAERAEQPEEEQKIFGLHFRVSNW
jgi:hypothetical protein